MRHAAIAFLQAAGLPVRLGDGNDGMLVVRGVDVERVVDGAARVGVRVGPAGLKAAFVGRQQV